MNQTEQGEFDRLKAKADPLKAMLNAEIDGALMVAGNILSVADNSTGDPSRGFKHIGDFAQSVASAVYQRRTGVEIDRRLIPLAAAPSTAGNEGAGTDGGILVPPSFSSNIFKLSLDEDSLLPLCDDLPIEGNSMLLPKDETTPWGTTGPRVYWQSENGAGTPGKPVFTGMDLRLKKLFGITPMTNELLEDSTAMAAYLPGKLGSSVRWKTNEGILFGTGAGQPLGVFNSPSVITIAKDVGQVTATLSATNLANMYARLPPGSAKRAVWYANNDVLPALLTLTLGNYPIMLPLNQDVGAIQGEPIGQIFGRPVVVSQHCNSFSTAGDLQLLDLAYYQAITKAAGIQMATSMHLYFDADATAFRISFRVDGQPKLQAAISPAKGGNKLSPFVQLGAR
jgi:HK97 family phage major capsid protein